MPIITKYPIPTGYLFTSQCSKGLLETLSIGDYGKPKNVKADFLGFRKIIEGVPNCYCMPLSEKWVITVSTQYGCVMKCNFCDVPFDVLVFVPSIDEEDGLVTCGNAVLGGSTLKYNEDIIKIEGLQL